MLDVNWLISRVLCVPIASLTSAETGIETYLVTAPRGECSWQGDPADYPGPQELGRIREAELRCAAENLGVRKVSFLDSVDGDLDQADTRSDEQDCSALAAREAARRRHLWIGRHLWPPGSHCDPPVHHRRSRRRRRELSTGRMAAALRLQVI